jgi:hypothetical protein
MNSPTSIGGSGRVTAQERPKVPASKSHLDDGIGPVVEINLAGSSSMGL